MNKERIDYILAQAQAEAIPQSKYKFDSSLLNDITEILFKHYAILVIKRGMKIRNEKDSYQKCLMCAKWLTDDKRKASLLLYGLVGSGKSTLLNAIYNTIYEINESKTLYRAKATKLSEIYENNFEDIEKCMTAKFQFVLIDDAGEENLEARKKYSKETVLLLNEILNARYDKQLPTILTSNLSDDNAGVNEFKERYGDRFADRMVEMFDKIYFDSESYRE